MLKFQSQIMRWVYWSSFISLWVCFLIHCLITDSDILDLILFTLIVEHVALTPLFIMQDALEVWRFGEKS